MNQTHFCHRCSFQNADSNLFCAQCGNDLKPRGMFTPGFKVFLIGGGVLVLAVIAMMVVAILDPKSVAPPRPATASVQTASSTPAPTPVPTPQWTAAERLAKAKDMFDDGKGAQSKDDLTIVLDHLRAIPDGAPEAKQARPLQKKVEAQLSKVVTDEGLLGPKPDNNGWDGSVRCVDKYLKQTLNDYDSAEYMEWSPVFRMDTKEGPYWAVRLKLRAKNGFGAYIVKNVVFFIRQNQVVSAVGL